MARTRASRERETKALELVAGGMTMSAVAAELGYADHSGVSRAVNRALDRRAGLAGDQLRALADAELEELRGKLHHLLSLPGVNVDQAVKVIAEIRKLQERQSRLHGLDSGGRGAGAETVATSGHRNDFTGQKGFWLVIDGAPVRDQLPYDQMTVNANPGIGHLQPPIPAVVVNPAILGSDEAVRWIIARGGLRLDGVYFSVPAESVSALLIQELRERTGPE